MFTSVVLLAFVPLLAHCASPSILIIIRSQPNSYHSNKAALLQRDLEQQAEDLNADIKIIQVHKEWPNNYDKAWALLPIMRDLAGSQTGAKDWIMFVEDSTIVNVEKLLNVLQRFDPQEDNFLARGLFDNDMVIIHHFTVRKAKSGGPFLFPDFEAGWVLSSSFVKKVGKAWSDGKPDFQIDLKHEVAVYFSDNHGVEITKVPEFCGATEKGPDCATNAVRDLPTCDRQTTLDDVFVAVKTTLMFHKDRVKVVMDTWGPKVKNLVLYSNFTDPSIPTIDCGVPNTVRGHCGKTDAIIHDFWKRAQTKKYKWLVITDDDTILSVSRLLKLLNCYDHEEKTFMGEKYGYSLNTRYGYSYITGGGGMVMSKPTTDVWVKECPCPANDHPDDMFMGSCLHHNGGIITTHSPLFHQARPNDYADGYLGNQTPISFHKHWNNDPLKVYKDFFEEADSGLKTYNHASPRLTVTTTAAPVVIPSPLPPTPLENGLKDEL